MSGCYHENLRDLEFDPRNVEFTCSACGASWHPTKDQLKQLLAELDGQEDCEIFTDSGYHPNWAMRLANDIREVL